MRFSPTVASVAPLVCAGLLTLAPLSAQAQTPLVPVVWPNAAPDTDKNRVLPVVEPSALFAGKIGARKIAPNEIVYVALRPFPRGANRAGENETDALFHDAATKTLVLYGGLLDRAYLSRSAASTAITIEDNTRLTLYVDTKRTVGAPRNEMNDDGSPVTVTPSTTSDYYLELTNLYEFDWRLFDHQSDRVSIPLTEGSAENARKIARAYLIVAGVRYAKNVRVAAVGGAVSVPRNPQAEAQSQSYFTMETTLTDLFVVEAVTKKVALHYVPKPEPSREQAPRNLPRR